MVLAPKNQWPIPTFIYLPGYFIINAVVAAVTNLRFASGCGETRDSRSIEGKDKLAEPLTASFASLDHFMGFMELRLQTR